MAAAGLLTLAQQQVSAQVNGLRATVKRVAIGQMRPDLGELSFGEFGVETEDLIREHQLQHRIPEEFEPLVVVVVGRTLLMCQGGMCQRLDEQIRILELVADDLLQFVCVHASLVRLVAVGFWPRTASERKSNCHATIIEIIRRKSITKFSAVPSGGETDNECP